IVLHALFQFSDGREPSGTPIARLPWKLGACNELPTPGRGRQIQTKERIERTAKRLGGPTGQRGRTPGGLGHGDTARCHDQETVEVVEGEPGRIDPLAPPPRGLELLTEQCRRVVTSMPQMHVKSRLRPRRHRDYQRTSWTNELPGAVEQQRRIIEVLEDL